MSNVSEMKNYLVEVCKKLRANKIDNRSCMFNVAIRFMLTVHALQVSLRAKMLSLPQKSIS
jgi:hypothetical protein